MRIAFYRNSTSHKSFQRIKKYLDPKLIILPASLSIPVYSLFKSKSSKIKTTRSVIPLVEYYDKQRLQSSSSPLYFYIKLLIEYLFFYLDKCFLFLVIKYLRPNALFVTSDRTSIIESLIAMQYARNLPVYILPFAVFSERYSIFLQRGISTESNFPQNKQLDKYKTTKNLIFFGLVKYTLRSRKSMLMPNPYLPLSTPYIRMFSSVTNSYESMHQVSEKNVDLDYIFYQTQKSNYKPDVEYDVLINLPHYYEHGLCPKSKSTQIIRKILHLCLSAQLKYAILLHPKVSYSTYSNLNAPIIKEDYFLTASKSTLTITCPSSIVTTLSRFHHPIFLCDPLDIYSSPKSDLFNDTNIFYVPQELFESPDLLSSFLHFYDQMKSTHTNKKSCSHFTDGELEILQIFSDKN